MRYYLKKARKQAGLTQAEIAKKVGIARTSYTNIELGIKNPSFDVATKIKKVLNVNDDNIFLNIDVPKSNVK
ncbi:MULTISPECIES: helix-turn-helix transcriptional regulator [Thermoanaerobacteraceae]|uniref:Putative transcriptional regulator n=1 Tax=Caldanaerobacter subterraneus TaxID=911092 RepID=A0A4V2S5X7_9THEO|nr:MULTISPECIES: helix-turn-helix transcriptional regulator [Thermoanaerobacteraceae]TCO53910.1 putative transcriptional regulator [Caldanaerobacter subterraneus]UZQ82736.1 helix-turn-helix domain-containing protein [Thermoanaerobacter sp. RKWS2]